MKANEFRLGNFIYKFGIDYIGDNPIVDRDNFEIIKVDIDVLKNIEDFNGTTDFYYTEPIPLTEEILLKCGFQIRDKKYSLNYGGESMRFAILENDIRNPFILYFHGRFGFNLNEGRKNGDYCIEYVNQLQNLYFALTNEELTFNNL